MNPVLQGFKNVMYASVLGQAKSAITQISDIGISAYVHGLRPTMLGLAKSLIPAKYQKSAVRAADLGLTTLAQELASTNAKATARYMEWNLKWSGFQKLDVLGKETIINAAFIKARKQAMGIKGINKLQEDYGKVFGTEFPKFVDDLRNGRITENVKFFLFNKLADMQPISLSEMPSAYLNSPNGRIFYALKTFTIKQFDLARRQAAKEFAKGRYVAGFSKFAGLTAVMAASSMTTDAIKKMLSGQPLGDEDFTDRMVNALYRNWGTSEFILKHAKEGKIKEAIGETILPPLVVFEQASTVLDSWWNDTDMKSKGWETVPLYGKFLRYWVGNGLEEYEQRERSKEATKRREEREE
jgi:hypothetical protein